MEEHPRFTLNTARSQEDFAMVGQLFREYAQWLQIDANFPQLDAEIATLPGQYGPPRGELLLAKNQADLVIGCIAVRPLDNAVTHRRCEMKRLYVREAGRGLGAGRALTAAAVAFAVAAGYQEMVLDTLPTMLPAISIYQSLGFREIAPYFESPGPGALYFGLTLQQTTSKSNVLVGV